MPEQWIPKAGQIEKECSEQAFEEWWTKNYKAWDDMAYVKKIAFDAWENQRQTARRLIQDILETIKETK